MDRLPRDVLEHMCGAAWTRPFLHRSTLASLARVNKQWNDTVVRHRARYWSHGRFRAAIARLACWWWRWGHKQRKPLQMLCLLRSEARDDSGPGGLLECEMQVSPPLSPWVSDDEDDNGIYLEHRGPYSNATVDERDVPPMDAHGRPTVHPDFSEDDRHYADEETYRFWCAWMVRIKWYSVVLPPQCAKVVAGCVLSHDAVDGRAKRHAVDARVSMSWYPYQPGGVREATITSCDPIDWTRAALIIFAELKESPPAT